MSCSQTVMTKDLKVIKINLRWYTSIIKSGRKTLEQCFSNCAVHGKMIGDPQSYCQILYSNYREIYSQLPFS